MSYRHIGVSALILLAGCENPAACDLDTVVIEAEYRRLTYELDIQRVERYESYGYDCVMESIRNGYGNAIGAKYTCTKCN